MYRELLTGLFRNDWPESALVAVRFLQFSGWLSRLKTGDSGCPLHLRNVEGAEKHKFEEPPQICPSTPSIKNSRRHLPDPKSSIS